MTEKIDTDLCIIGAGSAGLSIAAGAAQLGRKVVLIEKGEMGGDCLNTGCVPSKALLSAASHAHLMRNGDKLGIQNVSPQVDYAAVMDHVHGVIAQIAPVDSQERFEGFGVNVIRDHASFEGPRTVRAGDKVINAKHFVVATGSTPFVPPIDGLDNVPFLTNETLFENRTLPRHLIVMGGGPIGIEMAQAHRRLGANVTVIEGASIMNKDDPELVAIVREQLLNEGIELIENVFAEKVEKTEGGIRVHAGNHTVDGSHLLVAVGRKVSVEGMDLEAAGVEYDRKGIKVDDRLRSTNKRIYAAGDVAGGPQFTHVAGYHASIIIRNVLFKARSKNKDSQAPWVTYCDPELAHIGLTEHSAKEKGINVKIARWSHHENDRAIAERDTRGLTKVITDKGGKILGASIVGKNAGDLIHPFALAMSNGMKIKAFTNMISPYPTRGEAAKRAAGAWYTPTLFSDRTRKLVSLLAMFD